MSGRGGGRGWRGRGRGPGIPGAPGGKDEDGNTIEAQADGPPADFPSIKLPSQPEVTARDQMLLMRRNDLWNSVKKSPFVLEAQDTQTEDVNTLMDWFMDKSSSSSQGGAGGSAGPRRGKRGRPPLTSIIKLLSEYFPEELYSSHDRKYAKLQDTYFKRAGKKDDTGLQRLDQLLQMEGAAGGRGGGTGEPDADEQPPEEELHDTDDEEDMADDDYYQGAEFDDDEGYDDGFDDGGDDGAVF